MAKRTTRSNGRASRRQILEAATELAAERGYEGTSISAVSKRSGLPASSIYWHFANKDDLFAALIDDSYERWLNELGEHTDGAGGTFERMYASLAACPDFVRLGLMITLEQAPHGADRSARTRFLEIRRESLDRLAGILAHQYPDLDADQSAALSSITLALIDGTFVASVAGEDPPSPSLLSNAIGWLAGAMADNTVRTR